MSIKTLKTKTEFFATSVFSLFLAMPVFVEISMYSIISLLLSIALLGLVISGLLMRYSPNKELAKNIESTSNEALGFIVILPAGIAAGAIVIAFYWVLLGGLS